MILAEGIQSGPKMFLSKALEKILEEKEVRRSQHLQLKKACESALEEIRNDAKSIAERNQKSSSALPLPRSMASGDTERYFLPFELALQSRNPRFATLSLDCLQKLIAYGHFSGNKVDATNTSRRLMDRLVEVVCECFNNGRAEDGVQLQIVKLLLTIIVSNHVEIHGESLLLVIRTCYNIHLFSREKVTQEIASGSLEQMIHRILLRMEEQPEGVIHRPESTTRSISQLSDSESSRVRFPDGASDGVLANGDRDLELDPETMIIDADVAELLSAMLTVVSNGIYVGLKQGTGPLNPATLNETDESLSPEEYSSVPPSPSMRPRNASVDAHSLQSVESGEMIAGEETTEKKHCTVWEKDAYNVFRSLCKLSMKPFKEPADVRAVDYRSKILSLKLILSMLQSAGVVFRFHPMFIDAIKKYLCVSLSKNGVSSSPEVFRFSLLLFLELLKKFKSHLKMQIEVFFRDIFLNILESSSTSFTNKSIMMDALTKICADAQCVVDLYVNYDCDLTAANLFARIVSDLTKIAQGTYVVDLTVSPQQAQRMRHKGYQCIVGILNCMVEWSKELYTVPHQMSNLSDIERGASEDVEKGSSGVSRNSSSPSFGNAKLQMRSPGDSPSHLEERKQQKEIVEQGIDIFNKKPRKGLEFLQEHAIVGLTEADIATFLHREERLDKTQVGDFLSENVPYARNVMHAYIDQMDFAGKDIVQALRIFLEGFRLPGEAQKIDRLMEKFASRYCENNPDLGIFASADTAYVLAYSIIMLTTDLHSPQVKNKMTREQYIKMNRGINDQKDLPEEYLSRIYDEIAGHEIRMKTAPPPKPKAPTNSANPKQRKIIHNMEMVQVAQAAKVLMENVSHVQASFTSAKHCEHVRPMFKICWTPFLAVFSLGLQDSDDAEINQFCLEGFRYAIRVACVFHMGLERDAYIQALARFTLLTASSPLSEMKAKNVDTIKTLISVAQTDGNYLGHCWLEILKCVSQLELAQLIGSGNGKFPRHGNSHLSGRALGRSSFVFGNLDTASSIFDHELFRSKVDQQRITSLQESIEEARSQNMVVAVDRIFTSSITLDGDAIVEFVRALCQVSLEELHSPSHFRMYSLQKIVEISYYNMDRIRLQWSRIWQILGQHFNEVGCNSNEEIASFAVDSLRQLSMKFLEKGEFAHFRFQKDFLRPFEHIMKTNRSPVIRDMIVHCITQMVSSKPGNIKSGWKNIFSVLHYAAADSDADLVELAFRTILKIIMQYYEQFFTNIIESFQDSIKCLAEFACNINFPDTSMEAIRLIRVCARYVAEKPQVFREHALDFEDHSDSSERVWVKGWFPILLGLSVVVNRCKLDVRTRALTVLFEIIKTYGYSFAAGWWKDLFQVLFRLFDDLKLPQNHMEKAEWMTTTCSHALFSIVDVMTQYFDPLGSLLLDDVYAQLKWCITQDNEQLARSGTNCFETLILSSGSKFDSDVWRKTCDTLANLLKLTLPSELLHLVPKEYFGDHLTHNNMENHTNDGMAVASRLSLATVEQEDFHGRKIPNFRSEPENPTISYVMVKCIVQLELIQAVENIVFFPATCRKEDLEYLAIAESGISPYMVSAANPEPGTGMYCYMSSVQLFDLINSLLEVHTFCQTFDMNEDLRIRLSQSVFRAKRNIPGLLKQEIFSFSCVLRLLFRIYGDPNRADVLTLAENLLLKLCREAIGYFCSLPSDAYRETWKNVVILILIKVMKLETDQFRRFANALYQNMCLLLTVVQQTEIKNVIRWFFSRCGDTFQITLGT